MTTHDSPNATADAASAVSAPVIGITTYVEPITQLPWVDQPSSVLSRAYSLAVEAAGGLPLLIVPRDDLTPQMAAAVLDRLDGLVIAGGADVDPSRYGEEAHPSVDTPRRDRDESEIVLALEAQRRGMPLLGICRGMQVMAVAAGGRLEQHVPDRVGHDEHSPTPGAFGSHPVTTVAGSRVRAIVGERTDVPTHHHQAVAEYPGFEPAAWHEDGTLEAMERRDLPFCLGVQWHPEEGSDPSLLRAFVDASRSFAAS